MSITAHSSDVKLPPGKYQISTAMRSLLKGCYTDYKPRKKRSHLHIDSERVLSDAAINDPYEVCELWNR